MRAPLILCFGAFLALAAAPGCVTSTEPDVNIQDAPGEDDAYNAALQKATQERKVIKDFETRYQVTATYLSPEFRSAFSQRLARVYVQDRSQLDEAGKNAGFIVSITSPTPDRVDLANPNHWTLLLKTPDGAHKPVLVKKLEDKERWRAFFPAVTPWTSDYLIVFDSGAVDPKSPALVEKTGFSLTFANADAQVLLSW